MMTDAQALLKQAVDTYGKDSQIVMALEECGELVAVLTQWMRGRRTDDEVIEEIADVSIMMRQLRMIFGYQKVNEVEIAKIARLKKRLDNQKEINAILDDLSSSAALAQAERGER